MFVCPLPDAWHKIYERLQTEWTLRGKKGDPPPRPCVLSGWSYSNDVEKALRWCEMVDWAKQFGLEDLVRSVAAEDCYEVETMSTYAIGPTARPMYLAWNFERKRRPSADDLRRALEILSTNWREIVGIELAEATIPIRFTGSKKRRLLVKADSSRRPPWHSYDWNCRNFNEDRRAFTRFRTSINEAISPQMVDHVAFKVKDKKPHEC